MALLSGCACDAHAACTQDAAHTKVQDSNKEICQACRKEITQRSEAMYVKAKPWHRACFQEFGGM